MTANKSLKTFIIKQTKKMKPIGQTLIIQAASPFCTTLETKLPMQAGNNLKKGLKNAVGMINYVISRICKKETQKLQTC